MITVDDFKPMIMGDSDMKYIGYRAWVVGYRDENEYAFSYQEYLEESYPNNFTVYQMTHGRKKSKIIKLIVKNINEAILKANWFLNKRIILIEKI